MQTMKIIIEKARIGLVLVGTALLLCGCRTGLTTSVVWRIKDYHPASPPNLRLSTLPGTSDVLVQYDEQFARSHWVKPRAYWLLAYAARDTNSLERPKPRFVNTATLTNLCPVMLPGGRESRPMNGWCALPSWDQRSFTVWQNGTALGEYRLPVYSNAPPATWGRVALTPVAVTTDAAIVAAVICAAGLSRGGVE